MKRYWRNLIQICFVSFAVVTSAISIAHADCIDTLSFFLPSANYSSYSGVGQITSGNWDHGSKITTKGDAHKFEYHTWDNSYIYLNFDSTNWNPANTLASYPYSFDSGHWMPRWWCVGQSESVSTSIRYWQRNMTAWGTPDYSWSANQAGQGTHNYKITFENHQWIDMGGNIGWVEAIVMRYDRAGGWEEFSYAKGFGWVKWVQNDGQSNWMNWRDQKVVTPDVNQVPVTTAQLRAAPPSCSER